MHIASILTRQVVIARASLYIIVFLEGAVGKGSGFAGMAMAITMAYCFFSNVCALFNMKQADHNGTLLLAINQQPAVKYVCSLSAGVPCP